MSTVAVLASVVLAVVFAVAGWTKARDPQGTRAAVRDFGVPAALAAPVAFLLPVAEITVAILLLFKETSAVGALGAVILLTLFIAAISVSLARGRQPDCHCFGQVRAKPVSGATLVRNGLLMALAVIALLG